MDLADAIERGAICRLPGEGGKLLARLLGISQCLGPVALELQDFCSIDQALAAVAYEVGLRLAPLSKRCRPFARPAPIEYLVARLEHAAVDVAGDHRRHFVGKDGDHCLVQKRHAVRDAALPDQRMAPPVPGETGQITISCKPSCNLEGLREGRISAREVACADAADCIGDEQIAANDTVAPGFIEETTFRDRPAARSRRTAVEEPECQPARAPGGRLPVAALQYAWCARLQVASLSASRPVRYVAVASVSSIRGCERRLRISFEQVPARLGPGASLE